MAFKLIRKGNNKVPFNEDKIVVLKTSIRFPMKMRKKNNGFYTHVNVYEDKNKYGFEFTDDSLTGYSIVRDRIPTQSRGKFRRIPRGLYNFTKEKGVYIINISCGKVKKFKKGCGEKFNWAHCELRTCGEDFILPSGKRIKNYYLCNKCKDDVNVLEDESGN